MTTTTYFTELGSPLGDLRLVGDGAHLTALLIAPSEGVPGGARRDGAPFREAADQLERYFAGGLATFSLPLAPAGTAFQRRVWAALREIPYGRTTTYGRLAERLGHPGAARAVGLANGRNPVAIVIPCHRVVGSGGSLTGYAAGIERKRWLLTLESGHASPLDGVDGLSDADGERGR